MATDFAKLRRQLAEQRKAAAQAQSDVEVEVVDATEPASEANLHESQTNDSPHEDSSESQNTASSTEPIEEHEGMARDEQSDEVHDDRREEQAAPSLAAKLAQRLAQQKHGVHTSSTAVDSADEPVGTELDEAHFAQEPEAPSVASTVNSEAPAEADNSFELAETELAPEQEVDATAFGALLLEDDEDDELELPTRSKDEVEESKGSSPTLKNALSPLAKRPATATQNLRPTLTPEPKLPKVVEQSQDAAETLRRTKAKGKKKKSKAKKQTQKLLAAPVTTTVTVDSTGNSRELETPEVKVKRERKIGASKMSPAELRFYENLGLDSSSKTLYEDAVILLRPPIGTVETPTARAKRQRRVSAALDRRAEGEVQYRLLQRDREVLEFLAAFRYAPAKTLCAMFAEAEATAYRRLRRLRAMGLVDSERIYGLDRIWHLTQAGMVMSGFDLSRFTRSKLTFTMIPPQLVVNHLAANLWGATLNVIEDDEFPRHNRPDYTTAGQRENGGYGPGELVVSELEIQSSLSRVRGFDKADVYKPQIVALIESEFKKWRSLPPEERGPSPEHIFGHEFMWALYPPALERKAHHVPDLVVKRPRHADGSPASIAIEVELSNKSEKEYERTLRTYRSDKLIYDKVIWVCHTIGPARKLERVAKELGLWQEGRIQIVPILTKDGVFRDRDPWTL